MVRAGGIYMEKYSSGLVSESFWFVEFKQFIKLRVEGKSWDEIKELCLKDNLLGISKEYHAKRIFGYYVFDYPAEQELIVRERKYVWV